MSFKGYGFGQVVYLLCSFFCTKISYPTSRLIRLPFFFRVNGEFSLGYGFTSGRSLRIDVHDGGDLSIGSDVQINDNCQIACAGNLTIGNDVLIASKVFITDHDHNFSGTGPPIDWGLSTADVSIADGCWLGNGVHILKGVTLGKGSIVGAGSVVTKSFPEASVIAGVPAKLISVRHS